MVSHRNIWPRKISGTSDEEKIHLICGKLLGMKMSPKQFITGFLTKKNSLLRYRCRTWTTKYGWTPTIKLVQVIANDFRKTREGSARWAWFIQAEAISILQGQSTPKGNYPRGSFQSACTVTREFFEESAINERNRRLTTDVELLKTVDNDTEDEELDADINQYLEHSPDQILSIPTVRNSEANPNNSRVNPDNATDPTDESGPVVHLSSRALTLVDNLDLMINAEQMEPNPDTHDQSNLTDDIATRPNLLAAKSEELSWDGYVLSTAQSGPNDKDARAEHVRNSHNFI
ncbi:hypothetical protein Pst134EB_021810 [Puccinia striiformis f. sp. tritici]|nr:hypothetical protein Pst134EB_021810 [Puccinia striiformis f. sp. tritici]